MVFSLSEVITIGVMVASVAGIIITNKNSNKAIKEDFKRLEAKQDKYNNLKDRVSKVEESTKSSHNRLNDFKQDIKDLSDTMSSKLDKIYDSVTTHVEKFHLRKEEEK